MKSIFDFPNPTKIPEIRPHTMALNKHFLKQAGIFLLFCIGFWLISMMYLNPALDDKTLQQGDMQQVELMRYNGDQYRQATGEYPGWSPNIFSGMPANLINGTENGNWVYRSHLLELFNLVKTPFNFLYLAMLSMFVMLLAARVNKWLAAAGAIGYAFMTFTISSYEAGHITKVLAMDVLPGFVGGLILLSRRKYLWGAIVTALFFAAMIGFFHYQVAYYAGIIAAIFFLVELIYDLRNRDYKHAAIAVGLAITMTLAGMFTSISKIIDTKEYAKTTMRGGSEMDGVPEPGQAAGAKKTLSRTGLDIDYAFSWSYSPTETFTLLIPRFMGGSSNEQIENELPFDTSRGVPLYWGELQFTSGPVYIGAIFIFLFILGIFVVLDINRGGLKLTKNTDAIDDKTPQPTDHGNEKLRRVSFKFMLISLIAVVVSILLSWGRYFGFNEWLFNNLPYYNAFRTPMMALMIAQVLLPFFGIYALHLITGNYLQKERRLLVLKRSAIATGVLFGIAALILFGADFTSTGDKQLGDSPEAREALSQLKDLRSSAAWADLMRSVILIALAFGLVWGTIKDKLKPMLLWIGMIVFIGFDLLGVANRYVSEDNWTEKVEDIAPIPSKLDQQLMAFNKEQARVLDVRRGNNNTFNSNFANPFHRNIGGYHPAKMSRYQDIISHGITATGPNPEVNPVLDMLNARYILAADEKQGEFVQERKTALGNAWFVQKATEVRDAKAAMARLTQMNPGAEAVYEAKENLKPAKNEWTKDSNARIAQIYFSPDTIKYAVTNPNEGLAVFSEVYYNEKNGHWMALIDGKEAKVLRLNYILRGLEVPAGAKNIEFRYMKTIPTLYIGIEKGMSFAIIFGLLAVVALTAVGKVRAPNEDE